MEPLHKGPQSVAIHCLASIATPFSILADVTRDNTPRTTRGSAKMWQPSHRKRMRKQYDVAASGKGTPEKPVELED